MHWCEHPICPDHPFDQILTPEEAAECSWCSAHDRGCGHARFNQCPPQIFSTEDSGVDVWMLMAGRGFGKSRTAAEWLADQMKRYPGSLWALCAPERDSVQKICLEGESGLLKALGVDYMFGGYNKSSLSVRLPNGATCESFTPHNGDKVRGRNLAGAWVEEIASPQWTGDGEELWHNLRLAMRVKPAKIVVASTPKPVKLVKELVRAADDKQGDGTVAVTYGSTFDNAANLEGSMLRNLQTQWNGTRRAAQELYGQLLEDVPGALWTVETLERTRGLLLPEVVFDNALMIA